MWTWRVDGPPDGEELQLRQVGPHFTASLPRVVGASNPDLGVSFEAIIDVDGDKLSCRSVTVTGSGPITNDVLRQIPMAEALQAGAQFLVDAVSTEDADAAPPPRRGGRGPSDEQLRYLARVYRRAAAVSKRPTRAVSEAMDLPHSTAAKWVIKARERGILEPSAE